MLTLFKLSFSKFDLHINKTMTIRML